MRVSTNQIVIAIIVASKVLNDNPIENISWLSLGIIVAGVLLCESIFEVIVKGIKNENTTFTNKPIELRKKNDLPG